MNDRFEATFVVDVPPEEVWAALARRDPEDHARTLPQDPSGQVWLPGFEAAADIIETIPGVSIRARKAEQPCKGTEIAITLEAQDTGTKVTVIQSGFGATFDIAVNWLGIGWDYIVRDIILYLERGTMQRRYMNVWGPDLGCVVREVPSGLVVAQVTGGAAQAAGLAKGDHILTLAGVPIATTRDLTMVARTLQSGQDAALAWLRGSAVMSGAGPL